MAKRGKKSHQGPIAPKKPGHALPSIKGDQMAHPSHAQFNKQHGTPQGFAPAEGYQQGSSDSDMGDNEGMCD